MAQTVSVIVGEEDRARLAAIASDRTRPLKHVQRAHIILHSAERRSVLEVAGLAGVSRPAVWRWQARWCCQANAKWSPVMRAKAQLEHELVKSLSFKRHRFPADVIVHAVWLYFGFTLSFRDVEEMLAQRGIDVSYETIRCWTIKFGPQIARRLKRRRLAPSPRWHLDEMVCKVGGKRMYLWRAVDDEGEGEVLDLVMQRERDTGAALKLLRRLFRNQPVEPTAIVTDGLTSYGSALRELGLQHIHRPGRLRENNRAENSHLAIRKHERRQQGFKSKASAQRFLTAQASIYSTFYTARHLISRRTLKSFRAEAHDVWLRETCA
jgi:putative transposase